MICVPFRGPIALASVKVIGKQYGAPKSLLGILKVATRGVLLATNGVIGD